MLLFLALPLSASAQSAGSENLSDVESIRRQLVISEFMYHPPAPSPDEQQAGISDEDEFEFVELHNTGPETLDLTNLTITGDIRFSFREHALVREIPPGGHLLAVRNLAAFTMRYGSGLPVAGQWCTPFACGQLSQQADKPGLIGLRYGEREQLTAFSFADRDPWPSAADGGGFSVEMLEPGNRPDHADPASWGASYAYLGSPGAARIFPSGFEVLRSSLRISEIRVAPGDLEFIELCNAGSEILDLSQVLIGNAVEFAFSESSIQTLAPGSAVLVVRNSATFESFYGPSLQIAGSFSGALSASGETITLSVGSHAFVHLDYGPLILSPNGGVSAAIITLDEPLGPAPAWIPATLLHGHPGAGVSDFAVASLYAELLTGLRLSEIRTYPDELQFVELTNFGTETLSLDYLTLGGWLPYRFQPRTSRTLEPGKSVLIVADQAAFEAHYGPGLPIAGQSSGRRIWETWVSLHLWGQPIASTPVQGPEWPTYSVQDPLGPAPSWTQAPHPDGDPGIWQVYSPPEEEAVNRLRDSLRFTVSRGGAPDLAFVELSNTGDLELNLSPLTLLIEDVLQGGLLASYSFTQSSFVDLPPGAAIVVAANPEAYEERYGPGLPVAGPIQGTFSPACIVRVRAWGALIASNEPDYEETLRPYRESLRITEYRLFPEELAFMELANLGVEALDLSLVKTPGFQGLFSSVPASDFPFPVSPGALLGPGETVLLVANRPAFEAQYGLGLPVAGQTAILAPGWARIELVVWGERLETLYFNRRVAAPFVLSNPYGRHHRYASADTPGGTPGAYSYLTYGSWKRSFEPPLSPGPEEDSDGDHSSQLLEYACATDPRRRDGSSLRLEAAGDGSLRLVFPIRPGIVDVNYCIDRLGPDGSSETLLEHVPGQPNPLLSIRAREAAFTLPLEQKGQTLYRLRVRLLSPLP